MFVSVLRRKLSQRKTDLGNSICGRTFRFLRDGCSVWGKKGRWFLAVQAHMLKLSNYKSSATFCICPIFIAEKFHFCILWLFLLLLIISLRHWFSTDCALPPSTFHQWATPTNALSPIDRPWWILKNFPIGSCLKMRICWWSTSPDGWSAIPQKMDLGPVWLVPPKPIPE